MVEKRFVVFVFLSMAILVGHAYVMSILHPPERDAEPQVGEVADEQNEVVPGPATEKDQAEPQLAQDDEQNPAEPREQPEEDTTEAAQRWVALGSAEEDSAFPLLVYINSQGAALERAVMSSHRYRELDDRSGYLGYLALEERPELDACEIRVVGPGTPAAKAGLQVGDLLLSFDGEPVVQADTFLAWLQETTRPGQTLTCRYRRGDDESETQVTLTRRPLEVIRPEWNTLRSRGVPSTQNDPLSLLMTLASVDGKEIGDEPDNPVTTHLRNGQWELIRADENSAEFAISVPEYQLRLVKRFRLESASSADVPDEEKPYHLRLELEVINQGNAARTLAYNLAGPNGLPTEGFWYAHKISRNWGTAGLRDVALNFESGSPMLFTRASIVDEQTSGESTTWRDVAVEYIGVDAQYFSAALIPLMEGDSGELLPQPREFATVRPVLVGNLPTDPDRAMLANVSFQMTSQTAKLEPGERILHPFQFFLGPKKPELLDNYGPPSGRLSSLLYYGWFSWAARPMLKILHFFYAIVGNYGIAIVMLTVLVRSCLFPLSYKQAISTRKMQELQPEIKRIAEKYKKNVEQRTKAQQELFRKHNYNPLGGCLLMFVQLPILIGLYRSLMVDVELRQAPLISDAIRWCSNLSAPDMLFFWGDWPPRMLFGPLGWLGPYFNVLPLVTCGLFLLQTKMFMPPPVDEQAEIQQKMMKFMTLFMGVLFFKVASGLCIYFTASSLWGIAERRLLPKPQNATAANTSPPAKSSPAKARKPAPAKAGSRGRKK